MKSKSFIVKIPGSFSIYSQLRLDIKQWLKAKGIRYRCLPRGYSKKSFPIESIKFEAAGDAIRFKLQMVEFESFTVPLKELLRQETKQIIKRLSKSQTSFPRREVFKEKKMTTVTRETHRGTACIFVDPRGRKYPALITEVWGPQCVNLVYVNDDKGQRDTYGQKLLRSTSVMHGSIQQAHGNYWMLVGEERSTN